MQKKNVAVYDIGVGVQKIWVKKENLLMSVLRPPFTCEPTTEPSLGRKLIFNRIWAFFYAAVPPLFVYIVPLFSF